LGRGEPVVNQPSNETSKMPGSEKVNGLWSLEKAEKFSRKNNSLKRGGKAGTKKKISGLSSRGAPTKAGKV